MQRWTLLLIPLLVAGCATSTTAPVGSEAPTLPNDVHWIRNSAEYRAAMIQAYHFATLRLEELVAEREPGSWAVALDADETVISNSQYEKELALAGESFARESWDAWISRKEAPPLPGALAFLARVRELGGKIAIVTNRDEKHCALTADDFREHAIPFDVMLCKQDNSEKEPRWEKIGKGKASPELPPLEIVMWLGDNIGDFPDLDQDLRSEPEEAFDAFGARFFVLPNPMYGSWVGNPKQ
ncbi:MAG: hypothetical protein GY856_15310 [bacterium]|nr:hypothetical protein [bacterium]